MQNYVIKEIESKRAYKDIEGWMQFPNDDKLGHVNLEDKRLIWLSAMHQKITYEDPIKING